MPLQRCQENGETGWRWGEQGKCYTDADKGEAKKKAIKQAIAEGEDPGADRSVSVRFRGRRVTLLGYSEDQPRDDHGRWSPDGGGGGVRADVKAGDKDPLGKALTDQQEIIYNSEQKVRDVLGNGERFTPTEADEHAAQVWHDNGGIGPVPPISASSEHPDWSATQIMPKTFEEANVKLAGSANNFANQVDYETWLDEQGGMKPGGISIVLGLNATDQVTLDHELAHALVYVTGKEEPGDGHGVNWQNEFTQVLRKDDMPEWADAFKAAVQVAHEASTVVVASAATSGWKEQDPILKQIAEPYTMCPGPGALTASLLAYSEDEPRDERGRWTGGGGGVSNPEAIGVSDHVYGPDGERIEGHTPKGLTEASARGPAYAHAVSEMQGNPWINSGLRNGIDTLPRTGPPSDGSPILRETVPRDISLLESAAQPLAEDETLFRVYSTSKYAAPDSRDGQLATALTTPGAVIADKGFVSTSTAPDVGGIADQLKWNSWDDNTWVQIEAPKGTPVVWLGGDHRDVNPETQSAQLPGGAPYEALLMPGTSLEITGPPVTNVNGEPVAQARVVTP